MQCIVIWKIREHHIALHKTSNPEGHSLIKKNSSQHCCGVVKYARDERAYYQKTQQNIILVPFGMSS